MRATAIAPPNIALIKYWGKRDAKRNLPAVGSLSLTLDGLSTSMDVDFDAGVSRDTLMLNGSNADHLLPRVSACLDRVAGGERPPARVVSLSNFPVAAGLASSASSFAALVLAGARALGRDLDTLALARLAGAASGSAARSLYDGFVLLKTGDDDVEVASILAADRWPLAVIVAITAAGAKPVSSGDAMIRSERTSPFYPRWVAGQDEDLATAERAVAERDFATLAELAEHNCLKMHSVMWTSRPAIVYWNRVTLACMSTVRALRAEGVPVFFTIDAGPQLKAVCPPSAAARVREALADVEGVLDVLDASVGDGAKLLGEPG